MRLGNYSVSTFYLMIVQDREIFVTWKYFKEILYFDQHFS